MTMNAKKKPEPKTYYLVPTLIAYASFGGAILGVIEGNRWLVAISLVFLIPAGALLIGGPLMQTVSLWRMRRHPENYDTTISEDADGNITGVKWTPRPKPRYSKRRRPGRTGRRR